MNSWIELEDAEYDEIWNRFRSGFLFRPSVDSVEWPGIREPSPSITYDLRYPQTSADDPDAPFDAIFRNLVAPEEFLYVLDWQHTCYRFFPHRVSGRPFPISIFPDGDYSIFLARDLSFGTFGHPWEESVCVFGKPLLLELERHHPPLFTQILRKN